MQLKITQLAGIILLHHLYQVGPRNSLQMQHSMRTGLQIPQLQRLVKRLYWVCREELDKQQAAKLAAYC
jgi:hypothetical protein